MGLSYWLCRISQPWPNWSIPRCPRSLQRAWFGQYLKKSILTQQSGQNSNPGYYSKSAPATILNSFRIDNSSSNYYFYSTLIQKSKGTSYCSRNNYYSQQSWQITVAVGGNSIHPSKSSPWFQQHPMLLSAYLKELTPQSSAGSFSGSCLQQKYPPSPAKVFTAEIPQRSSQVLGIVS